MAESAFRTIELMDIGSLGKETIFNDAVENLARGISGAIEVDLTGLSSLTLLSDTDDLSLYYIVILTGSLSAACTLILPEDESRANIWANRTTGGQDVVVTVPDMSSNVTVANGTNGVTFYDGTTVIPLVVTGNDAVPQGSPGHLVRYRTDGLALEQTGWQITDGGALLGPVQTAIVQNTVSGELLAMSDQHNPAIGSVAYGTSLAPRLAGRRARGTRTLPSAVQADDALLIIEAVGHDGSALGAPAATVELQTEEIFTGAAKGTRVVMKTTASGTTTPVERLRLTGNGRLSLGIPTPTPDASIHILVEDEVGGMKNESYFSTIGSANTQFFKAYGSQASPQKIPVTDVNLGGILAYGYVRNVGDTADEFVQLGRLTFQTDSIDAQGRAGAKWRLFVAPAGGASSPTEVLRVSQEANLGLGATPNFGTGATKTLLLNGGVAPSTSPADSVQLTAVDRGGTAGKRSLLIRTEDGTTHVLGDFTGIATTTPRFALHVNGRLAYGVPNSAPTDGDLSNGQLSAYVDESGNNLIFRVKYSDGTLKTGTVALT